MISYTNGNANVLIDKDGSRLIEFEDSLKLEYPLNIDIRTSSKCSFGLNQKTGSAFCSFCHESATTDGDECDYGALMVKLDGLPAGIELAIGGNSITAELMDFCAWATNKGFIINLTVNHGHILKFQHQLDELIENEYIKGLGISYRRELNDNIPERFKRYKNTVLHVIAGIDNINDILNNTPFRKVLVLGEKDFGFNKGNVNLDSIEHREWFWWVHKMFSKFDVVSFDNLALEQLKIKRFFSNESWEIFNQGEHSMYISAVDGYFAPSSRNSEKTDWNSIAVKEYFKLLEKK